MYYRNTELGYFAFFKIHITYVPVVWSYKIIIGSDFTNWGIVTLFLFAYHKTPFDNLKAQKWSVFAIS
jgi:hypothetical protein